MVAGYVKGVGLEASTVGVTKDWTVVFCTATSSFVRKLQALVQVRDGARSAASTVLDACGRFTHVLNPLVLVRSPFDACSLVGTVL